MGAGRGRVVIALAGVLVLVGIVALFREPLFGDDHDVAVTDLAAGSGTTNAPDGVSSEISTDPTAEVLAALSPEEVEQWIADREELRAVSQAYGFPDLARKMLAAADRDLLSGVRIAGTVRERESGPFLCLPGGPDLPEPYRCDSTSAIRLVLEDGAPGADDGARVVVEGDFEPAERSAGSDLPWLLVGASVTHASTATECSFEASPGNSDAVDRFAVEEPPGSSEVLREAFVQEAYAQFGNVRPTFAFFDLLLRSDDTAHVIAGTMDQTTADELALVFGRDVTVATLGALTDEC